MTAHSVSPHMHLLGRDMQISVKFPDGRVQDLIKIPDWDFNWQYTYQFEKPLDIPKGSVVYLVSHYDNSASNPRNPHKPPELVKWGEATTDEMCIGFLGLTKKGQDLTRPGEKDDFMDILRKQAGRAAGEVRKTTPRSSQSREAKSFGRRREIKAEAPRPDLLGSDRNRSYFHLPTARTIVSSRFLLTTDEARLTGDLFRASLTGFPQHG